MRKNQRQEEFEAFASSPIYMLLAKCMESQGYSGEGPISSYISGHEADCREQTSKFFGRCLFLFSMGAITCGYYFKFFSQSNLWLWAVGLAFLGFVLGFIPRMMFERRSSESYVVWDNFVQNSQKVFNLLGVTDVHSINAGRKSLYSVVRGHLVQLAEGVLLVKPSEPEAHKKKAIATELFSKAHSIFIDFELVESSWDVYFAEAEENLKKRGELGADG